MGHFFKELNDMGFLTGVVSNNSRARVERFCRPLGLMLFAQAQKPRRRGLRHVARRMGLSPKQMAVIGDQIFTDVWAANRAGMLSVLVEPVKKKESLFFKLKRVLERPVLRLYENRQREEAKE